jgi:hypothetical protein
MMNEQMTNVTPSREPIYHETCLTASDCPGQTLRIFGSLLPKPFAEELHNFDAAGHAKSS